ncbi:MAG: DNA-3-methyladenine glycosylase I [Thermoplasmataceae archaeon]
MVNNRQRCGWVPENDAQYTQYHDTEWGVPLHDDLRLFEMLILEGQQAGLSWRTILYKRQNFRNAFDNFEPERIAGYDESKIESLLRDQGIIRNRLKIYSVIQNARTFLEVKEESGTFSSYIWKFVGNKPVVNRWKSQYEVPSRTRISDEMSRNLSERGFKFTGSTICYSFMQAVGMVNDHVTSCFRHEEISEIYDH